jgi:hypothetical protein
VEHLPLQILALNKRPPQLKYWSCNVASALYPCAIWYSAQTATNNVMSGHACTEQDVCSEGVHLLVRLLWLVWEFKLVLILKSACKKDFYFN